MLCVQEHRATKQYEHDEFVEKMQSRLDNNELTFLGVDKHGFRYYRNDCPEDAALYRNYVYQQYPTDRDCWENGTNKRGKYNGWAFDMGVFFSNFQKTLINPE